MSPITSALSSIVALPPGLAAADPAAPVGPSFGAALDALSALVPGTDKTALPGTTAPGLTALKDAPDAKAQPEALGDLPGPIQQVASAAVAPVITGLVPKLPVKAGADDPRPVKAVDPEGTPDLQPAAVPLAVTPLLPVLPIVLPAGVPAAEAVVSPAAAPVPAGARAVAAAQPAAAPVPVPGGAAAAAVIDKAADDAGPVATAPLSGSVPPAVPQAVPQAAVSGPASGPAAPVPPTAKAVSAEGPVAPPPVMAASVAAGLAPASSPNGKPANAPIATGGMRVTNVQQTILHATPESAPAEAAAAPDPASLAPVVAGPASAPATPQPLDAAVAEFAVSPVEGEKKTAGGAVTDATPPAISPLETRADAADITAPVAAAKPADHPAPAAQIAPALTALATGRSDAGHRLSITLAPEQLGSVGITIERVADGSTTIHVTAERLETLHLLQQDQADLSRSLDQAGVAPEHRTLSFSWSGEGGQSNWSGQGQSQSQGQGYTPNHRAYAAAYNDDQPVSTLRRSLDTGSIDITA